MNRHRELYDEVMAQTRDGALKWRQIARQENAEVILDSLRVVRQFTTTFVRFGITYTLLCVEKRQYIQEDLFFGSEESVGELLFLRDGELIERLAEPTLYWLRLSCMAEEIAQASDRASQLYKAPAEPTLP